MPNVGRIVEFFRAEGDRRSAREIALVILLRQEFSGDLGGHTQTKYGGHRRVPIAPICWLAWC